MNDTTHEQLSALMDGELPRDELRFFLRRLEGDAELARRWSRYQIASAVLRQQYAAPLTGEAFVSAVMGRLDGQLTARRPVAGRALRWAGGGAIAAAVAVFALVAVRPSGDRNVVPATTTATIASAPAPAAAAMPAAPVGELHDPLLPQQVLPVGSIDYAQPAAFESIVPNYVPQPRTQQGQFANGGAQGFVPYVLLVGSRQAQPQGQGQAMQRREAPAQQQ